MRRFSSRLGSNAIIKEEEGPWWLAVYVIALRPDFELIVCPDFEILIVVKVTVNLDFNEVFFFSFFFI